MEKAQDTGDVYRFGPLRSVIPYSCVLVDLCMKKLQRAGEPESSYSRNPLLPFFSLVGSTLLFLSGQGPPFISQGDTTCTLSPSNLTSLLFINGRRFVMVAVRM